MYESPEPDSRSRFFRGAPQVVLAASGVVLATVFAAVASLAAGSDNASETPSNQLPRKEAVRDALSIVPTSAPASSVEVTSSSVPETTTSTTTPKKNPRVTTITRPDGTTTTVTTEDPPTNQPTQPTDVSTPNNPSTPSTPSTPSDPTTPSDDPSTTTPKP